MLYTLQPPTGLKVWNTSPNVRYRQETVRLHFNSPNENGNTVKPLIRGHLRVLVRGVRKDCHISD